MHRSTATEIIKFFKISDDDYTTSINNNAKSFYFFIDRSVYHKELSLYGTWMSQDLELYDKELLTEWDVVQCIYPEVIVNSEDRECSIKIPVFLDSPIVLKFHDHNKIEEKIEHLPPIECKFNFPKSYPTDDPPIITLSNTDSWLNENDIEKIQDEMRNLWSELRSPVIFTIIDYLKTNSQIGFNKFNNSNNSNELIVDNEVEFQYFINENELAKIEIFNNLTFLCDICQNEEKGVNSTQFPDCNHIFCNKCLKDYFTHIIQRGEIENIHCPSFQCTKKRKEFISKLFKDAEIGGKEFNINNFEIEFFKLPVNIQLLERFLDDNKDELIKRYQTLHFRNSINNFRRFFPNRVTECPRSLCGTTFIKQDVESNLTICPSCKFAFCCECFHSWHGKINSCSMYKMNIPIEIMEKWIENNGDYPSKQNMEQREICSNISFKYGKRIVELAVSDYIAQKQFDELIKSEDSGIVKCPSCSTFIQKSDGCNKMTCSKCLVFFCILCGDRLDRNDPYEHYNNPLNPCFGKLFLGLLINEEENG